MRISGRLPTNVLQKRAEKGEKWKQNLGLVLAIVIESKAVSKVNAVKKAENGDLLSKSKKNAVFFPGIRNERLKPREGKKPGSTESGGNNGSCTHSRFDGKHPVEILMVRSITHPNAPLEKE